MNKELKTDLINTYKQALQPPYFRGFRAWAEENIILPAAYAISGKLDLGISPYLHKPMEAIDNPNIMQINLGMATQVGKSLVSELFIPYSVINNPGPLFRIFHSRDVSDVFTETRLIPLLKNCEQTSKLLKGDRFSAKKSGVVFPHTAVTLGSADTALQHGMSVKYLLCDELHQWKHGVFDKFLARTTAFAGRRKIIVASQPSEAGSEWEALYNKGFVYEWQWTCPNCKKQQPFHWSKSREDGSYAGFNWDTILNPDGSTNIAESAKTTWLECECCKHKVNDTPTERRLLNDTGDYVCVKRDGDASVVSFTAPNFVNINLSFAYAASQYMVAKRMKKLTGLDEQLNTFVTQILGKFYKREEQAELSSILVEAYDKDKLDKDWTNVMTVDVQRTGNVKYWLVRAWHKNGNESRRIDFGVARDWEDIEKVREKYKVPYPLVGVDSGDGSRTQEIYQECIKHGQVVKVGNVRQYASWCPLKGDGKVSYKHSDDVVRLYSPISNQDSQFPIGHKLKGIPAPLILWSNYSVKTILANLRDNKISGVVWKIDRPDSEYDTQMYSESLLDVVDKKSGVSVKRWIQTRADNHWLDVEAMNLVMAMRANVFSATKINEEDIKQLIANSTKKEE